MSTGKLTSELFYVCVLMHGGSIIIEVFEGRMTVCCRTADVQDLVEEGNPRQHA